MPQNEQVKNNQKEIIELRKKTHDMSNQIVVNRALIDERKDELVTLTKTVGSLDQKMGNYIGNIDKSLKSMVSIKWFTIVLGIYTGVFSFVLMYLINQSNVVYEAVVKAGEKVTQVQTDIEWIKKSTVTD